MKFIKNHPYLFAGAIDAVILIATFVYIMLTPFNQLLYSLVNQFIICLFFVSLEGLVLIPGKFMQRKKRFNEEKEYREKYISEFAVTDKKFGDLVFERDSNKNVFTLVKGDIEKLHYGKYDDYSLNLEIAGDEELLYRVLRDLADVYEGHEKYMNDLYDFTLKTCDDRDERDSEGNPIDMAYVEKIFTFTV